MSVGAFGVRAWYGFPASCLQQPGQSGKIVGSHCQDEVGSDAPDAPMQARCNFANITASRRSVFSRAPAFTE